MSRVTITADHAELIARKLGEVASRRVRRKAVNEAGKAARKDLPELIAAAYHTTKTGVGAKGRAAAPGAEDPDLHVDPQSANQDREAQGERSPVQGEARPADRPAEAQARRQDVSLPSGEGRGPWRIHPPG